MITLFAVCMGIAGFVVTVNNLGDRVTRLEDREEKRGESLQDIRVQIADVRGDMKVLLERTNPPAPNPFNLKP